MQFGRIDATEDALFDAWFGVLQRSELSRDGEAGQGWHPDEWRARSIDDSAPRVFRLYSFGPDLESPVAVGALEVTRDDNLAFIEGNLWVDPSQRRRGYGSALLAELEACSRELGRPTLVIFVIERSQEIGTGPNRTFAPRHGYRVAEEGFRRDLAWPRPAGELDGLWSNWIAFADDYEILSWNNGTPEDLVEGRAHLSAIMPAETPHLDIDVEAEHWDAKRVRIHEATTNRMGRDLLVAAARHRETGELVGFSELTVSREQPQTAYQWDTLVVSAHRGHRLGGLLKVETMRLLETGQYPTTKITTFNSKLNEPMIAVNEALGARVAGAMVAWRKDL
ncbi:MAG TPA: GNAT family N-acetyltransferase [Acidimicrobiales bacterium]|nr:GNAT family N-acetyltransferase [Acidimicrobiales bacterium]